MSSDLKLALGWPFPDFKNGYPYRYLVRCAIVTPLVGTLCKVWIKYMNSITVHNEETFAWWVNQRDPDQPLITVSNHHSCMDDPFICGVLPLSSLWSCMRMRWSLAAHDICFTKAFHSFFFSSGKCVPVIRGLGVYQDAMDFCVDRLRRGEWVHIFPEGKVNLTKNPMRLKWGVGRLVLDSCTREENCNISEPVIDKTQNSSLKDSSCDNSLRVINEEQSVGLKILSQNSTQTNNSNCKQRCLSSFSPVKAPIVLPMYHIGMDEVLPNMQPYIPQRGKKITLLIGDPIDTSKWLAEIFHRRLDAVQARKLITDRIQDVLAELRVRAERLHDGRAMS